jgi:hypothetical protein
MKKEYISVLAAFMGLGFVASLAGPTSGQNGLPVPPIPGPGFTISGGPEFYGTERQPLENGHIFHFIDGGGVVYINHGFRAVVHIIFADQNQNSITVDIFDMGNAENALNTYADESICPGGYAMISIGVEAKSYHFEPDYFVYFVKGRYLVYCHINNDALSSLLTAYAKTIAKEVL